MMSDSKSIPKHVCFFVLIIFCSSTSIKLCCSIIVCPEIEKQALLKFKQSLNDSSNMLSSWNINKEDNCCMWKGVVCSNLTGHVHQLRLRSPGYYEFDGLSGKLNPSILNLKELKYLDLSLNNFGVRIPSFVGLLTSLEYLNLSYAGFHGTIPRNNGVLTANNLNLSYHIISRVWSIWSLEYLNLSYAGVLTANNLHGEVSYAFGNISDCFLEALTSLSLRSNQLSGHLTPQFGDFKRLQSLDLGRNSISGAIPVNIGKLSSLNNLQLDYNKLSGNLPESLGELLNLEVLDIEHNMLEGTVTETHFSNLSKLIYLYAAGNHLSLEISSNWVPPFTLDQLTLRSWNLGADNIPLWIQTQNKLSWLDISNTGVSGKIPTWLWEISSFLSHNNLHGQIPFIRGSEYDDRTFYLSSNRFRGSLPRVASSVTELDLSNNSFTGGLSHFLCDTTYQTYRLEILHLGGNNLSGEFPDCWIKWPSLIVFTLANNNFSGKIPNSIGFLGNMWSFDLEGNKLWGQIPISMQNCTKLLKLDLSGNGFSGNIPAWMGTSMTNLKFLILRSNKLSGKIHSDICHLNALQTLDLSNNVFSGVIPKCVNNFTAMATKRSLDKELIYSHNSMESASVSTKGKEYTYDIILSLVTNIDLSSNNCCEKH